MAITYKTLLANQKLNDDGSGYTRTEVRSYSWDEGDIDLDTEDATEQIMLLLPALRSYHPMITITPLWLTVREVGAISESQLSAQCNLTYKTPTYSLPRGVQNENNETWEWQMVAQQSHITSAPASLGGVRSWDNWIYIESNGQIAVRSNFDDPDLGIRKNLDKTYDGADVYRGSGALRVTKYYEDKADVGETQRQAWYAMQATVNDAAWQDWTAGEVLYLGATITYGIDDCTVQHQFLFGDTKSDVVFKIQPRYYDPTPVDATVPVIQPWYYVWQEPAEITFKYTGSSETSAANVEDSRIVLRNVKVAQVYDKSDFSNLGLVGPGTGS